MGVLTKIINSDFSIFLDKYRYVPWEFRKGKSCPPEETVEIKCSTGYGFPYQSLQGVLSSLSPDEDLSFTSRIKVHKSSELKYLP